MNISATLNVLRLFLNPKLCIPQAEVANFSQLPVPIGPSVKAVVLDKDNCFAYPHENEVWPEYEKTWLKLKQAYPNASLLIVSNSAGSSDDPDGKQANLLESKVGVSVLRHAVKKPGCRDEIMEYFASHNITQDPKEIAVVGDRLFTDILMANLMGSQGIWVRDGVKPSKSPVSFLEKRLHDWLNPGK
ncbi:LANO_0B04632g1_1 [Lachancea nothofagi CBS 11611]|uniref:LANO_0B04632g1_1 n=1 Tax=Lachancea nothofagi CBS 11611 TaxID=1266666 RepID=A0A1G4IXZ5_9SACH|nr:LANO_0B04632g1_1 [Lachancea nothofagi CBS 11611]